MGWNDVSFKEKKVISIGTVSELTGLSERQIRYYEERKLIFPSRSKSGMRRYSFNDIELLADIANQIEDGVWTNEIRKEMRKREKPITHPVIKGQLNVSI